MGKRWSLLACYRLGGNANSSPAGHKLPRRHQLPGRGPTRAGHPPHSIPPPLFSLRKHRRPHTRLRLLRKAQLLEPLLVEYSVPSKFLNWHRSLEGTELWVWTDCPGPRLEICQSLTRCGTTMSLWADGQRRRERQNLPCKFSMTLNKWKE